MLSSNIIDALIKGRKIKPATALANQVVTTRQTATGPYAITRSGERISLLKAITEQVGAYEGKVGSLRRSRKGRTYRLSNGRRYYNNTNNNQDILAYKVSASKI